MATLSDPLYKPNKDEPHCPGINDELLVLKSREEALMLKSCGNKNYKTQNCPQALNFYTKAILMCPRSLEDQKKFLDVSMELLRLSSPAKYAVAKGLYYTANGSVIGGSVEEDTDFKKELLLAMMPDMTPETVATPVGPDPLLAQCYGNRSAVLYEMKMYEDSLADIKRALNCGFPSESAHKLEARREKCKTALLKEDSSSEASSDSSNNDESPTTHASRRAVQSDAITVASSPELGRHLKAARDIHAGEVILSEESSVSVLNCKYITLRCSYCFEVAPTSLIPCLQCPCEGYCSAECRLEAWVKYHWLECKLTDRWRKDAEWTEVMCLRVVASADPADVLRACKGLEVTGDYGTICKLFAQESKSYNRQRALLSAAALNLNLCFGEYLRGMCCGAGGGEVLDETSLKKLFRRHLLQLRCNGYRVSDLVDCCPCGAPCTSRRFITSVRYMNVGMVILPTASLMNHSCSPNTHFRFEGTRVFVCAMRAVKKGEELTVSYIPQVDRMNTTERREALQEKYFFHCHCPPCQGNDPEFSQRTAGMEGLACTSCSDGAVVERGGDYRCCSCGTTLSKDQAQKLLQVPGVYFYKE